MPRCELGVRWNPALFLRPLEDPLAVLIPAIIELAFVLICPFFRNMVRAVDCAAGPVHKERFVRLKRTVPVEPSDGVISQVLAQVVTLFRASSAAAQLVVFRTRCGSY